MLRMLSGAIPSTWALALALAFSFIKYNSYKQTTDYHDYHYYQLSHANNGHFCGPHVGLYH